MFKKESIKKNKKYYYKVLPAYNINSTLVYSFYEKLIAGTIVVVDLRKKETLGCIMEKISDSIDFNYQIKNIKQVYVKQILDKSLLKFVTWFASYNLVSSGNSLKLFLPNKRLIEKCSNKFFSINKEAEKIKKLSIKQKKLLLILDKEKKTYLELNESKFSKPYLKAQIKNHLINEEEKRIEINHKAQVNSAITINLNKEQDKALNKISNCLRLNKVKPVLFDGVMGSGKTEVYFKIIEHYIKESRQVLVLLPEIVLSSQWIKRFESVFGFSPLVWNSDVTLAKKNLIWQSALNNDPIVVIGARSSLFLPFGNLGIVIIDEENDMSYKQEDGTIYNARDMAIVRANLCFNSILLVSATPSLETYHNAKKNKYNYVKLTKRFSNSQLPIIKVIDMKKEKRKLISLRVINEIRENIKKKKQSLILINRRGYAPIQVCFKCGHVIKCKNCSINLVLHKKLGCLICHHCGEREEINYDCNKCNSKNSIISIGFGIEKIFEEIKKEFYKEKIIALSSDVIKKNNFSKILQDIENNNIKIIIGTQIISKGFDFSNLAKVFILDFDMWFYNSDIRTGERVFQLSQQVSGRAGRRDEQGEVFIQSYYTKNKLLEKIINSDRDLFYEEELAARGKSLLPPYTKMASVVVSGKNLEETKETANNAAVFLSENTLLIILGPIPAPIFFLRREYRYRLILKSKKPFFIQDNLKHMIKHFKYNNKIKLKIDIDPYSFF